MTAKEIISIVSRGVRELVLFLRVYWKAASLTRVQLRTSR